MGLDDLFIRFIATFLLHPSRTNVLLKSFMNNMLGVIAAKDYETLIFRTRLVT